MKAHKKARDIKRQNIISLFDGKFSLYFENKQTQENLILNQSFNIFKKCVNYIINNN